MLMSENLKAAFYVTFHTQRVTGMLSVCVPNVNMHGWNISGLLSGRVADSEDGEAAGARAGPFLALSYRYLVRRFWNQT